MEMGEIYLGLSQYATLSQSTGSDGTFCRKVKCWLPGNPEVINYDLRQSPRYWLSAVNRLRRGYKITQIASPENPLVTPSAGAVSVFVDEQGRPQYVSFCQKDAGAPRDPGFRVPRNGFPRSEEDWFTNAHLYREAFEEGIAITTGGELLVPEDGQHKDIIYGVARMLEERTRLRIRGEKGVPIKFLDGQDTLEIYSGKESKPKLVDTGVISWTPETGFNLIKVVTIQHPVHDLLLVDGERLPDGTPIQRDVCLINLHEIQGRVFGCPIEETVYRRNRETDWVDVLTRDDRFLCDKVPRSVLNQVLVDGRPVYPVDWMDESYAFLSDPKNLADMNRAGNMWSALEKKRALDKK